MSTQRPDFDPLEMDHYRIDRLPRRARSGIELWLARLGIPLAVLAFVVLGYVWMPGFLLNLDPTTVSGAAAARLAEIGLTDLIRNNQLMLAVFAAAMILWTTAALPNYLVSLIVIFGLIATGILSEREAYAQLGHPVMWLNIMSFILASMLVKTGLARRFAVWLVLRFGHRASGVFLSFIVINTVMSAFISATTAKAAILLPVFMVIAAMYGARPGDGKNNFGRNIVLQNLLCINLGAGAFMTGSGANLLAVALISGAISGSVYFSDWMIAMLPTMVGLMLLGYILGSRVFFPLAPEERIPQVAGGLERLQAEYEKMGKLSWTEVRAAVLFLAILVLWITDRWHGISATAVALLGGIVALLPRIGIVEWNDVDIPWHLMLFSAGAYCLGAGFAQTGLPEISVGAFFGYAGIDSNTPFWAVYLLLTAIMALSALVSQAKTMRAMLFVPIAIGAAETLGYSVISLALPVAFLIEHVYVLPFNSKPAALLYETDHYSLGDGFRYGIIMMLAGWVSIVVLGETWFRFLGITPDGVFGLF
ncbi:anion permease [Alcanivorax sp. JB21]|uniref:SLC13 family permease n=1 Tax=Alcanivorax limicola TaxID=2874102 RepID=UPI001CBACFF7|nr:SLC13 family permease [Alcanivorax limicola]MBZ2188572.1 anion permease [Alcanivorax limicola]